MKTENEEPLISIIVTVYGTEKLFDRCIHSLLGQTYNHIEIIVVNDGSPGNIRERIAGYLNDSRVKYVDQEENHGLLMARVIGANIATGEYIAFVDSDDYVTDDFYRTLLYKAVETDADITIGKTVWEKDGERFVYNYHEANFHFDVMNRPLLQQAYFEQETQCYSWHTVWNKLYKKTLWDKCVKEFGSVERHIVMTEDIYFSSILFYNADRIATTKSEAYFYCINENASTDSKGITLNKFSKNIDDIAFVFRKVLGYLKEQQADSKVIDSFSKGISHYGRMWKSLAENTFSDEDLIYAINKINSFCDSYGTQKIQHDYFFESIQTPWNGGLEYIKKEIRNSKAPYISFDIFDTLISRPFYYPSDLFSLLNQPYSKMTGNIIAFDVIRLTGERMARTYYGEKFGYEDITLSEIYDFISIHYGIDKRITDRMKKIEIEQEYRFCSIRFAGAELFEYAKYIGKKVILISDMYLEDADIKYILSKNNINGYDKLFISCEQRALKWNGGLYKKTLENIGIMANEIIHIGDTWKSDVEGAEKVGIHSIFFPKAREVFENKISGCTTNRCSNIAANMCHGGGWDYDNIGHNLGYRCMNAIAANYYFDNPYRTFNANSDFNIDPYFIGYYLLGMHMLGLINYIQRIKTDYHYDGIIFLARDGYLPSLAYKRYMDILGENAKILYLQASRRAVMPVMIEEKVNFFQLPIEYRAHTPATLTEVLAFAMDQNDSTLNSWKDVLEENGILWDRPFENELAYHKYIKLFLECEYDEEKHSAAKSKVIEYYRQIPDNWIAFDMGYSGRIQSAICRASGKKTDVLFVHEDYTSSVNMQQENIFRVFDLYNHKPEISGLMREHVFSDVLGSCIGFEKKEFNVVPVFEADNHTWPDCFVVKVMQKGAVDFVSTFAHLFEDNMETIKYSEEVVSTPYEAFLRYPSPMDMHIFSAAYFEDMVFGARTEINVEEFAMNNLHRLGWPEEKKTLPEPEMDTKNSDEKRILDMIHRSSKVKRALIWLLLDVKFLKEKIEININRIRK